MCVSSDPCCSINCRTNRPNSFASLTTPSKNWKFSEADVRERGFWNDYQRAYEDAINNTATPYAPWFAVPADDKRTMRLIVAQAVLEALQGLDMAYPEVSKERAQALKQYRKALVDD